MNKKMRTAIAVILAALMVMSVCILAGCGEENKDAKDATTATEKATEAATEAATQAATEAATQAQNNDATQAADGQDDADYMSADEAYSILRENIGSAGEVLSSYQGFTPDGRYAWVYSVSLVTKDDPKIVTYYINDGICFFEEEEADSDDGEEITAESEAVRLARVYMGDDGTGSVEGSITNTVDVNGTTWYSVSAIDTASGYNQMVFVNVVSGETLGSSNFHAMLQELGLE